MFLAKIFTISAFVKFFSFFLFYSHNLRFSLPLSSPDSSPVFRTTLHRSFKTKIHPLLHHYSTITPLLLQYYSNTSPIPLQYHSNTTPLPLHNYSTTTPIPLQYHSNTTPIPLQYYSTITPPLLR
ncbi:MAG: hypothetical protein K6D57_01050 [Paludibacteraceae bacterium]|nr:hypothetical protein [Paludibacteraceae bacterium]